VYIEDEVDNSYQNQSINQSYFSCGRTTKQLLRGSL